MKTSLFCRVLCCFAAAAFLFAPVVGCGPGEEGGSNNSSDAENDHGHSHDEDGEDHGSHDDSEGDHEEDGDAGHEETGGSGDSSPPEIAAPGGSSLSSDGTDPVNLKLSGGNVTFVVPASFVEMEPANNIVEAEFKAPKTSDDQPKDGRLTFTPATGGVEANIDRWIGQFKSEDGGPSDDVEQDVLDVDGKKVHFVDINGTFMESSGGPFGPKTERPDYRMLGAIAETGSNGMYFVKFYARKDLVEANKEAFMTMIKSFAVN